MAVSILSIVITIHNEEPAILPLYYLLTTVLESLSTNARITDSRGAAKSVELDSSLVPHQAACALNRSYEIIFVDDASTDRSFELLTNLVETDERLKVIRLRRNFGQTAALSAGFHQAEGDVIIAMDGDLQNVPQDIHAMLKKIDERYDIA